MAEYYRRQEAPNHSRTAVRRTSVEVLNRLDEAWLLSAFHDASRSLAQRVANEDGVPLGFDVLEFDLTRRDRRPKVTVTVTAAVLEHQQPCHAVRYMATYRSEDFNGHAESEEVLLARAAGWTWTPSQGPLSPSFAPKPPAEMGNRV